MEQSINRLENAIEKFEQSIVLKKSLDRPMLDTKADKGNLSGVTSFLKYGEKSLHSGDGSGSLVLHKPNIQGITGNNDSGAGFRNLARQSTVQADHFDVVVDAGGTDAGWAQETELGDETVVADLKKITIPTHEMYARIQISQRLLDDAEVNLEDWLLDSIRMKFGQLEEEAFLNGDGEHKPKGILKHARVAAGTGGNWGALEEFKTGKDGAIVNADIFIDVISSIKTPYLSKCAWVMSRSAFAQIRHLKEPATGRYLWQPGLQEGASNMLFGFPIVLSDAMPALVGDTVSTPIAFGNFEKGYQIVDRKEVSVIRDPYSAKPFVEFYVTQRLGGDVVDFNAIKLINAAA